MKHIINKIDSDTISVSPVHDMLFPNEKMSYDGFFHRLNDMLYNLEYIMGVDISFDEEDYSFNFRWLDGVSSKGLFLTMQDTFVISSELINDARFLNKYRKFIEQYNSKKEKVQERAKKAVKTVEIESTLKQEAVDIYLRYCECGEILELTESLATLPKKVDEYDCSSGIRDIVAYEEVFISVEEKAKYLVEAFSTHNKDIYGSKFYVEDLPGIDKFYAPRYTFDDETKTINDAKLAFLVGGVYNLTSGIATTIPQLGINVPSQSTSALIGIGCACLISAIVLCFKKYRDIDSLSLQRMDEIANILKDRYLELNNSKVL